MNDLFRYLHMHSELACEFLAVFSRMEYTLKASITYAVDTGNKVDAWWDQFANDHDELFSSIPGDELKTAVNYLLTRSRRKQVLRGGVLAFEGRKIDPNQNRTQYVLWMVRQVRNNLFHGCKLLPGGEQEHGRNEALVRHSLTVLKHCVSLYGGVRQHYEQ